MKKGSTAAVKRTKNFSQPKLTIGLDLGDRNSWYRVLDESGRCNGSSAFATNASPAFLSA
jgi:Ethanolamine utilization protein EutJ (predicted chaperonin)